MDQPTCHPHAHGTLVGDLESKVCINCDAPFHWCRKCSSPIGAFVFHETNNPDDNCESWAEMMLIELQGYQKKVLREEWGNILSHAMGRRNRKMRRRRNLMRLAKKPFHDPGMTVTR